MKESFQLLFFVHNVAAEFQSMD